MAKCYFFTGLPCSGKTTIAKELLNHIDAELLDGDEVRETPLTTEGFSATDRATHILRLGYIAKILVNRGINVVVSCIAPERKIRDTVRGFFKNSEFVEIYLSTSIDECKRRDVKGMYKKAEKGDIPNFTGVDAEYEAPLKPEITLDTKKTRLSECVKEILKTDNKHKVIFCGRFQPFHLGHKAIIDKELSQGNHVIVCIKFNQTSDKNPYTPDRVKAMIKAVYKDRVEICTLPDFDDFIYGRTVGYKIRQVCLGGDIEDVSATRIRGLIECDMNIEKYKLVPQEIIDLI